MAEGISEVVADVSDGRLSPIARVRRRLKLAFATIAYGLGRDRWQRPNAVVAALGLAPGMRVADLGAGLGYFTFRLASAVGPAGVVYAVDTDPDLRSAVDEGARERRLANVRTVAARNDDAALPGAVDLVFVSLVFHHLPEPREYFRRTRALLRPGGRIAVLEAKREGFARVFGHATPPEAVRQDMEAAGYRLASAHEVVPRQSLQIFVPA